MAVPPKRQALADELVRIRARAGLTGRDMARHLDVSQAQLYRYDKGITPLTIPKVRAWLDSCAAGEVDTSTRARLLLLAEEVFVEPRTWKDVAATGTTQLQDEMADREASCREIWNAQSVILPGMLQTPEYAAAAIRRADLHVQFDHGAALTRRLARQAMLFEPGRTWRFLLTQRLLSASPGAPSLLRPQLDRIASLAAVQGVEVAVLPTDAWPEPTGLFWAPFTLWQPHGGGMWASVELPEKEHVVREPEQVASYSLLWSRLWSAAVTGPDAVALIRSSS